MPLVIEFVKGWTVGVVIFQVQIVHFRFRGSVSTILTHIHLKESEFESFHAAMLAFVVLTYLWPPLLVIIIVSHTVNFEAMGLQRTTLSEWLLTEIALVGANTWKKKSQMIDYHPMSKPIIGSVARYTLFCQDIPKHWVKNVPVWVRVCLFKSKVSLKPLPQKVQRYRLVSLWHFMCRFKSRCKLKILEHKRHWNLDGSLSGLAGGSFSTGVFSCGSAERGFLIPCPPLMSSMGASGGIPNCNGKTIWWRNETSWL